MNILAIETSSEACSCALLTPAGLIEQHRVAPRQHTALLLPMVGELLAGAGLALADVDRVAYGRGPGSFTGVRIAACSAQGLALSAGRPVVPVSSLAAAALRGAGTQRRVIAAFDARLGEVYLAAFELDADGLPAAVGEEQLATPDTVVLPAGGGWAGVGAGWAAHGDALAARLGPRLVRTCADALPGAAQVARLAAASPPHACLPAAEALPRYLRRDVATPRRIPPPT